MTIDPRLTQVERAAAALAAYYPEASPRKYPCKRGLGTCPNGHRCPWACKREAQVDQP